MNQKQILFLTVLLTALVFLGNGCAAFREFFSTPGLENQSQQKKEQKKRKQKSGYESRRYNRDPLDALFLTDRQKSEDWSKNSNLNDAEKAALRNALDPEDDATRHAIDQIYRENEKRRKKRQDDIFGPNPFRN